MKQGLCFGLGFGFRSGPLFPFHQHASLTDSERIVKFRFGSNRFFSIKTVNCFGQNFRLILKAVTKSGIFLPIF